MELLQVTPGSDSVTCHDGNQVISIKVEGVTDIQEDEQPPLMKSEQEVCPCIQCLTDFTDLQIAYFLTHICLSIHMKKDDSGDWNSKNSFHSSREYIFLLIAHRVPFSDCIKTHDINY
jgi:hypothetical protein